MDINIHLSLSLSDICIDPQLTLFTTSWGVKISLLLQPIVTNIMEYAHLQCFDHFDISFSLNTHKNKMSINHHRTSNRKTQTKGKLSSDTLWNDHTLYVASIERVFDWQHESSSPRAFLPCCWVIMRTALSVLREERGHRGNADRLMGTKWTNYDAALGLWWGQTPPTPRSACSRPRSPPARPTLTVQFPSNAPRTPPIRPALIMNEKLSGGSPERALKQYFRADPHVKMLLETGEGEEDSSHADPGSAKYHC